MSDEVEDLVRTFPKSVQPGVPKLKAPQPGWRTVKFGDVLFPVVRPVRLDDDRSYRLVTVKRSRGGIEERGHMSGRQIAVKSQFEIEGGDFLISKRQIVHGACGIVSGDFAGAIVSNEYSVLRCAPELDLNFLRYLSHTIYFQQTCFHSSIGVHVEKMIFKLDQWLDWPVNLPTLPEQEKIAGFLGAVDGKISGLRRKEEGLKRFKAGLMQKLFSQELRFIRDDGTDFPDWQEKRLGTLVTWQRTNNLSREFVGEVSGLVQNIHYGDIHGKFSNLFRQSEANAPYLSPAAPIRELEEDDFCKPGDIVVADASEDYADIGKAIEIIEAVPETLVAGLHTHLARPKAGVFALGFAGYLLRIEAVRRQIMREAQGISVLGISKDNLGKVKVPLPHPDEQRKIADALSSLDGKIAGVRAQLAGLETFKKGLLQQMFV